MMKQLRKRLKNQKGLTLIELLAVIVILGIIAAIAIPSIGGIIQNSRENAVKADAIQIINAAKLYVSANGTDNIPDDGLGATELIPTYLDALNSEEDKKGIQEDWYVTVENEKGAVTYTFSGEGIAGDRTIAFVDATMKGINDAGPGAVEIEGDDVTYDSE